MVAPALHLHSLLGDLNSLGSFGTSKNLGLLVQQVQAQLVALKKIGLSVQQLQAQLIAL